MGGRTAEVGGGFRSGGGRRRGVGEGGGRVCTRLGVKQNRDAAVANGKKQRVRELARPFFVSNYHVFATGSFDGRFRNLVARESYTPFTRRPSTRGSHPVSSRPRGKANTGTRRREMLDLDSPNQR